MDHHLEQMIREKNQAFDALVRMEQAMARRERRGAVPQDWLMQHAELQTAYDEAMWAVSLYLFFRHEEAGE